MTQENEMTSTHDAGSSPATGSKDAEDMAKHGITRIPVDYFHVGGFRYTNLSDAIAQAKRLKAQD